MSSSVSGSGKLNYLTEIFRLIFYPTSKEEREGSNEKVKVERMGNGEGTDFIRGGAGSSQSGGGISKEQRNRMRDDIDSNTQLAKENRRMLVRIDERTAWIARLLVGVFMAILGAVYLSGGI